MLLAVLGTSACTDLSGVGGKNVVVFGRVVSHPAGNPVVGATVRLMSPPGPAGQREYASAGTDTEGRFEISIDLEETQCDGGAWDLHLHASRTGYSQMIPVNIACSQRTAEIVLHAHLFAVRVDPTSATVSPGGAQYFTATATLYDGTELTQPDPEVWELFWHVANDVQQSGADCGSAANPETNPVQYHAPAAMPVAGCSAEGGATVSLSVQAYGVAGGASETSVAITIADP